MAAIFAVGPTQKQIAGLLHQSLADDDALPRLVGGLAGVGFEHGRARLFDLQEQRIVRPGHQQEDAATRSHAADADDFHGVIGQLVPIQQDAAFVGERRPITFESRAQVADQFDPLGMLRMINQRGDCRGSSSARPPGPRAWDYRGRSRPAWRSGFRRDRGG